jgi:hypothetical protein
MVIESGWHAEKRASRSVLSVCLFFLLVNGCITRQATQTPTQGTAAPALSPAVPTMPAATPSITQPGSPTATSSMFPTPRPKSSPLVVGVVS